MRLQSECRGVALHPPGCLAALRSGVFSTRSPPSKLGNFRRLGAGGKPLGFLNPWIYSHADAFNDVVVGIIDHGNKKKNGGFEAVKGWDPATGVGTPNWPRMLAAAL